MCLNPTSQEPALYMVASGVGRWRRAEEKEGEGTGVSFSAVKKILNCSWYRLVARRIVIHRVCSV